MFRLAFRLVKGIVILLSLMLSITVLLVLGLLYGLERLVVNEVDSIAGSLMESYLKNSSSLVDKFKEWGE